MKIYLWHSELLKGYGRGNLVAMAESPNAGRDMLRQGISDWLKEHRPYEWHEAFDPWGQGLPDREGYDKLLAVFEADIAKEPTEHVTLWLQGSE